MQQQDRLSGGEPPRSDASIGPSGPNRTDTFTQHEHYQHELSTGNRLELDGDLYTNALISALGMPSSTETKQRTGTLLEMCCTGGLVVLVTCIQLLMAWAVYLHVKNDMILTKTRPLLTAFEMFVGTNITIPLGTVEALCGKWEDQEMKDFAQGPLSTMNMPDGSVFSADDSYSFFYNLKQPTRSWDYGRLGSERSVLDDVMFVLSEGVTFNPCTPSGYSLLFILVMAIFFFSINVELRQTAQFIGMLFHFLYEKTDTDAVWKFDRETEKFQMLRVPMAAQIMGFLSSFCRMVVAVALCALGFVFLFYTSLKIDLILNGLAILFVLELDKVIFSAVVPAQRQRFISDILPVTYKRRPLKVTGGLVDQKQTEQLEHAASSGPILMFPLNFFFAVAARWFQCYVFKRYFRMTSAICMFAGPTIPFARQDIMSPVAGFCDSLLGVSCAPKVVPSETAFKHGYCVITDQTTMVKPTIQFYLDDPDLFEGRVNADGSVRSWTTWGRSHNDLFKSKHWMDGPYQDLLRKNCLQIYQPTMKPDDVLVDDDVGETMDGAPFYCNREPLYDALFGAVFAAMDTMPTEEAIQKIADLRDPAVVKAVDKCLIKPTRKKKKKDKDKDGTNEEVDASAFYGGVNQEHEATQEKPREQVRKHHHTLHLRHGHHHEYELEPVGGHHRYREIPGPENEGN